MANQKISQLPESISLTGNEVVPIVSESGINQKSKILSIKNFILEGTNVEGATFTPAIRVISESQIEISFTNNRDLPNPDPVLLVAPKVTQEQVTEVAEDLFIPGNNITLETTEENKISINATYEPPITIHNSLSGRFEVDSHDISSITGLSNSLSQITAEYNNLDTKIDTEIGLVKDDLKLAYVNTVSYPIIDAEYNSENTWITFDNKLYRCIKNTIWTGTINGDWVLEYMTTTDTQNYVLNAITEALSGEFPLQMRPDDTFGVYTTLSEAPLTDNQRGYLIVITGIDSEGLTPEEEEAALSESGIYIWGQLTLSEDPRWLPFVVIPPVTENSIDSTFNNSVKPLKQTLSDIQSYVDLGISAESQARISSEDSINTNLSNLNQNSLIIGENVFRGTQAEYNADPDKNKYYLAIIIGG